MIKKNVIVSLADSNYFELLNELVDSIKRFKKSETTAICILDGGLTDEQKKLIAELQKIEERIKEKNNMVAILTKAKRAYIADLKQEMISSKAGLDLFD